MNYFRAQIYPLTFFGNNDGDVSGLIEKAGKNIKWAPIRKEFGEVNLEDRKIAFCYYKAIAKHLSGTKIMMQYFTGTLINQKKE